MFDTNQINQAAQDAALLKAQLAPYIPALAVAAAWLGREIRTFNAWAKNAAAFIIAHGGLFPLLRKLFWNPPPSPPAAVENRPAGS